MPGSLPVPDPIDSPLDCSVSSISADIAVDKTILTPGPYTSGKVVTYQVSVTNSGGTNLSNARLEETLSPIVKRSDPLNLLSKATCIQAGWTSIITYDYTITSDDVTAGEVVNTATITSPTLTASDTFTISITDPGIIDVNKTELSSGPYTAGQSITYQVVVTNVGGSDLSNVGLRDTLSPITVISDPDTILTQPKTFTPGMSTTVVYTYTVTEADVLAGGVSNTACVVSSSGGGLPVEVCDGAVVNDITLPGALSMVKTEESTGPYTTGDDIEYKVVVTNTGGADITGITISDSLPNITVVSDAAGLFSGGVTLSSGASAEVTYTYTVTNENVSSGSVSNTATIASDQGTTNSNTVIVSDIVTSGRVTAVKSEVVNIYYEYPTGSDTEPTSVASGTDSKTAVFSDGVTPPSEPADVTQAGGLSPYGTMGQGGNTFEWMESTRDTNNNNVAESRQLRGGSWSFSPNFLQASDRFYNYPPTSDWFIFGFRIAAITGPPPSLHVLVTVGDAGNVNDIYDGGFGGVSYEYRIGKYAISESDIDLYNADPVNSTLQLPKSSRGDDKPVTDISWNHAARYVNWLNTREGFQPAYNFTTGGANDNITLWTTGEAWQLGGENLYRHKDAVYFLPSEDEWYKAAYFRGDTSYTLDDTIKYNVVVTNTGGTAITNATVSDSLPGIEYVSGDSNLLGAGITLNPGQSEEVSYNYTVTVGDIANGVVNNTATVTSSGPTVVSNTVSITDIEAPPAPGDLNAVKSEVVNIYYDYSTGSDTVPTPVASGTDPYTAVYDGQSGPADVTQAGGLSPYGTMGQGGNTYEWMEGAFDRINDSAVESRVRRGGSWSDFSGPLQSSSRFFNFPFYENGAIGFRVASVPNIASTLHELVTIGDTFNADDIHGAGYGGVSYEYRIMKYAVRESDIDAYNADPLNSANIITLDERGDDKPATSVSWNEAARYVNWLNVIDGYQPAYKFDTDGANNNITLWTTGEAWQLGGENLFRHKDAKYFLPSEDEWYKAAYFRGEGPYTLDDTIEYRVVVTNTGGTAITNATVSDSLPGIEYVSGDSNLLGAGITLNPGQSEEVTYTYTVTVGDIANGVVNNTATVTSSGPTVVSNTVSITDIEAPPAPGDLNAVKSEESTGPYTLDDIIEYNVVVTNTGGTPITGIIISDSLPSITVVSDAAGLFSGGVTLSPGASAEVTYTYTVSASDIANGVINNTSILASDSGPYTSNTVSITDIEAPPAPGDLNAVKSEVVNIYYEYPTGSDTEPTPVASGTDPYTAVYDGQSGPADVDQAGGLSPYGTMGQGGNTYEWMEGAFDVINDTVGESRVFRGGDWNDFSGGLQSATRGSILPGYGGFNFGFRVASVPNIASTLHELVTIGDPGNTNDIHGAGYGGVSYEYRIGKYAISESNIDAYNADPANSTLQLPKSSRGDDKPATDISWNEAARYVNWLNTREGFQPAYNFTTGGANDNITLWTTGEAWQLGGENLFRHKDAKYFLPSEDEWYKAAYFRGEGPYTLDDTIEYNVVVTNTGGTPTTGIIISDSLPSITVVSDSNGLFSGGVTLSPGASAEVTYTYTVTVGDIANGVVNNTAILASDSGPYTSNTVSITDIEAPVPPPTTDQFTFIIDTSLVGVDGDDFQYTTDADSFKLPLVMDGVDENNFGVDSYYNFFVNWGDGTGDNITQWNDPKTLHTYNTPGVYTITITGDIKGWQFGNVLQFRETENDAIKYLNTVEWTALSIINIQAFFGCENYIGDVVAVGVPTLNTLSLAAMFRECSQFNGDVSNWDVSNVTDMNQMFYIASVFNGDIGSWDVSMVTNMSTMLARTSFDQDISNWNVSSVTDMSTMFELTPFNKPLNNWERVGSTVGDVENMSNMFQSAALFNQPLGDWNVSSVTDMRNMFESAEAFNRDLTNWERVGSTVGNVEDMHGMFRFARAFNGDVGSWNVSSVTDMSTMFESAEAFNRDLTNWERVGSTVGNVEDMRSMFAFAVAFNGDISNWDTSSVIDMGGMFSNADIFNGDISNWDTSSVTDMESMFAEAAAFNRDLTGWERTTPDPIHGLTSTVSSVTTMEAMFRSADAFNGDISNWNTSSVTNMSFMFSNTDAFNGDISNWNTSSVTDMSDMFRFAAAFNRDLTGWERTTPDPIHGLTSTVSSVTNMGGMFYGTDSFNGDISNWNTSSVTNMSYMFANTIFATPVAFNGDISNWNTSSVTDMGGMFSNADIFNGDISNWDTSSVTDMGNMFTSARAFNRDLTGWERTTPDPIHGLTSTLSSVTNMRQMFFGTDAFNGDISNWDIRSLIFTDDMFLNSTDDSPFGMDQTTSDNLIVGWNAFADAVGVNSGLSIVFPRTPVSGAATTAASNLTTTHGWTITYDSV